MKKILTVAVFSAALLCAFVSGALAAEKLNIITTIFPQYDFVRQITGDEADVTMLLRPGAESHSFEPTPQDIIKIGGCDMFVYVGGESDDWAERILEAAEESAGRKINVVTLMSLVDTVEEEIIEGMQEEEEEGHSHSEGFEDSDVKDRPTFADWKGDWQSGYPYVLDGTLEEVFSHKAEHDDSKTAEDYRKYYTEGYRTDFSRIVLDNDTITYYVGGKQLAKVKYEYKGFVIMHYDDGDKGVRYQFQAVGETNGAPKYIQFSDHNIGPTEGLEHFHLYNGNDGFEPMLKNLENWPTFYPVSMSGADIAESMKGHDHEEEYDEHVWTSPANAIKIVNALTDRLCELDKSRADFFRRNADAYAEKIAALGGEFKDIVSGGKRNVIVFGDRFPFRYFVDEYGLKYFAAFPGCSTETEASAATVAFLIDKVKAERIPVVFYREFSNETIADTISEATGAVSMLMHSCHNVTREDFERGVGYLELMSANAENLRKALN